MIYQDFKVCLYAAVVSRKFFKTTLPCVIYEVAYSTSKNSLSGCQCVWNDHFLFYPMHKTTET